MEQFNIISGFEGVYYDNSFISGSPTGSSSRSSIRSPDTTYNDDVPWLEIVEQPSDKFRFRYLTESQGNPHGPVAGCSSSKHKKTFPTVKLHNYPGDAVIRCWLFTADDDPRPHVHELVTRLGQKGIKQEPHDIKVGSFNSHTACFDNLIIIHAVYNKCTQSYIEKRNQFGLGLERKTENEIKKEIKAMDKNVVRLFFQAIANGTQICSVFSSPIKNKRNAATGDLRIVRSSRREGSALGGDEVFLFVEKITKEIKVRFYEVDPLSNKVVWESEGQFGPQDIHHQVALVFRTPKYPKPIDSNVKVKFELVRTNDNCSSNSFEFIYTPDYTMPHKRPYSQLSSSPDSTNSLYSPTFQNQYNTNGISQPVYQLHPTISSYKNVEYSLSSLSDTDLSILLGEADESDIPESVTNIGLSSEPSFGSLIIGTDLVVDGPNDLRKVSKTDKIKTELSLIVKDLMRMAEKGHLSKFKKKFHKFMTPHSLNIVHLLVLLDMEKDLNYLLSTVSSLKCIDVLNIRNHNNETALHMAIDLQSEKIAQILIDGGIDVNLADRKGQTALHLAVINDYPTLLKNLLLLSPTNASASTYDGFTALHLAVQYGHRQCVNILLDLQKDLINKPDGKKGDTPLHIAVETQNIQLVELLVKNGASIFKDNYAGYNSLDISNDLESDEITDFLMAESAKSSIFVRPQIRLDSSESEDEHFPRINGITVDKEVILDEVHIVKTRPECIDQLSALLDANNKWKDVAEKTGHSDLISSIQNEQSPSQVLLKQLVINGFEELINVFHRLNFKEALDIVGETH